MKKYLLGLIFIAIAALSASYYAPYYTVYVLQKAAVEGDLTTIQEYIDFAKVHEHAQGQSVQGSSADNDMIQAAVIAAILSESVASETSPKTLDMVMGYSGDDHFMLSLERCAGTGVPSEVEPDGANVDSETKRTPRAENTAPKNTTDIHPVIFVLEKNNFYSWYVTEILMNK